MDGTITTTTVTSSPIAALPVSRSIAVILDEIISYEKSILDRMVLSKEAPVVVEQQNIKVRRVEIELLVELERQHGLHVTPR